MTELTKAEEQIMRVIWRHEPLFIKDIIDKLPAPQPAYNTVGTFLKILENKGFVVRKKYGNSFEYQSLIKKGPYTNFIIKGFMAKYFEGSAEKMFSHFMKNNDLDLDTIESLRTKYNEDK